MIASNLAMMTGWDWAVVGLYFMILAGSGWYLSRRDQKNVKDYFLAGRRMPMWAAAISLMATSLSGATFVGGPESSYRGDLSFLIFGLSQLIGIAIVATLFIPAFYKADVATVYGLLEQRYGRGARRMSSAMFMAGRVFASGARLYIAGLAGSVVLFGDIDPTHIALAIGVMTAVGIAYTLMGGIEAVVWSDVIQSVVFVSAACAALWIVADRLPVDWNTAVDQLSTGTPEGGSKLQIVRSGLDGFGSANTWSLATALTGWVLLSIGSFGTDQDLTQRMLTCKSATAGARSAVAGIAISIPVTALFLVVGLGLWLFYVKGPLLGATAPGALPDATGKDVFLTFIVNEMPVGMSGLMMAGLFAAGLSSLNSALNSMASAFVNDFYREAKPGLDEAKYVATGRKATIIWGVILGAFAVLSIALQEWAGGTLIDYALGVMTLAYAGLVAVFLALLTTKRGNTRSAVWAMITGFLIVALLWAQPWVWLQSWTGWGWARWDIAAPWRMVIATAAAFIVCLLGKGNGHERESPTPDTAHP